MLVTSLKQTGVDAVDMSPAFRQLFDWITARAGGGRTVSLKTPDVIVSGSLSSLDFEQGGGGDIRVAGIGGGRRVNSIRAGFDGRATIMPFSKIAASGDVYSSFAYEKNIVGYENEFGITSFFGGGSTRSLFEVNFGKIGREPVQRVARSMMDVVAYRIVHDLNGYDPVAKAPRPWVAKCNKIFEMVGTPAPVLLGQQVTTSQIEGPRPAKALTHQPAPVQTAPSKQ